MAKKNNKIFKFKLVPFGIVLMLSYFAIQFFIVQNEITEKNNNLAKIEIEINNQTLANEELQRYLSAHDKKEYMERLAREKFEFTYPGEQVFYDMTVE